MNRKNKGKAILQIFILVFGIVAFAQSGNGQAPQTPLSPEQWQGICNNIATKAGPMVTPDVIKSIPSLYTIGDQELNAEQLKQITDQSLVENCKDNPAALKQLDDNTLLNGVKDSNAQSIFGENSKVFDAINERMKDKSFMEKFNSRDFSAARKNWFSEFKGKGLSLEDDAPQIAGFDKDKGMLSLKNINGGITTIDTKSVEGLGDKGLSLTQEGYVKLHGGASLSPSDSTVVKFGQNGWDITKSAGTVNLNGYDFSNPINLKAKDVLVQHPYGNYAGTFDGTFTNKDFRSFTNADMILSDKGVNNLGGTYTFQGEQLTIDGKTVTFKGNFFKGAEGEPLKGAQRIISGDGVFDNNVVVDKAKTINVDAAQKDAVTVQLNDQGGVQRAIAKGSGGARIQGPITNEMEIDVSQANRGVFVNDGEVVLENAGKRVSIEQGDVLRSQNLKGALGDGGKITVNHGGGNIQTFTNARGTISVKNEGKFVGNIRPNPVSSSLASSSGDLTATIAVAGIAAAEGGIIYAVSQSNKDKGKDKNSKKKIR